MKNDPQKELADMHAGFRILDVRCTAVDDDAIVGDDCPRESNVFSPAPAKSKSLSQFGNPPIISVQRRPLPTPVQRHLPTQPVRSRRKRLAWLVDAIRTERVPLLFALTGIATSAFLAMLFSMIEPRVSAALSVRDSGLSSRSSEDDIGLALAAARFKEGRSEEVVVDTAPLSAWFQMLKRIVIALPAVFGLSVLFGTWLLRLYRAIRPTNTVEASAAEKSPAAALRARKPTAIPEQQNKLRRAA